MAAPRITKIGRGLLFLAALAAAGLLARLATRKAPPPSASGPVLVAILDTGIDPARLAPAQAARIHPGDGADRFDRSGHGTRAAALVLDATEDARVLPIKISNYGFLVTPDALAGAIRSALAAGADGINVSAGLESTSPALEAAVREANRRDVWIVAAAGSGVGNPFAPRPVSQVFPQAYPEAIVVGTVSRQDGAVSPVRSENHGGGIDVAVDVRDGSSFAAAAVSGMLAREQERERSEGRPAPSPGDRRLRLRASTEAYPGYFAASDGMSGTPRGGFGLLEPARPLREGELPALECRLATSTLPPRTGALAVSAREPIRALRLVARCGSSEPRVLVETGNRPEHAKGLAFEHFQAEGLDRCALAAEVVTVAGKTEACPVRQAP